MKKLNHNHIRAIFSMIRSIMVENKDFLFQLDSVMGDGDLGLSMSNGFSKVDEDLKSFEEKRIGEIINRAGMILSEASPSTCGTLFANGLLRMGETINGKMEIDITDISTMFDEMVKNIIVIGNADYGEKTIVDALYPAAESLKKSAESGEDLETAFKKAYESANEGFELTKDKISKHGRARWFGEKSIGNADPGAGAGMLFIKAFYNYFEEKNI